MSRFATPAPRQRVLVAVAIVVALALAGSAFWFLHGAKGGSASAVTDGQASAAKDDGGVGILLDLAKTAVGEHRLVAPAGSNAYEFYLSVLQLDPSNKVALDDLHDSFPTASAAVERAITDNELDEAQRELSLLGGKLDAQRQIMIRQDEARAAVIQSQQSAASGATP